MPKRVATPPPSGDEFKYLVVNQPYPLNAHFELLNDIIEFARWIACCIGIDPFIAFFHKPKARGKVILEIKRTYTGFDGVLGEHRWSEFLRNPSEEEKDRVSQIFYCTHSSDRAVQKDGWKRINVQEKWFKKDWSPLNGIISHPYPPTRWCNVPPEDRTNKPLCRPLPVQGAPPPPPPPTVAPPVVGSPVWVMARATNAPTPQAVRGARGRGAPTALTIPTRGSNSAAASVKKSPASNLSNNPTSPRYTHNKGMPSSSSTTPPWSWAASSYSDASSPASSVQNQSASPPPLSPQPAPNPTKISWADDSPTSSNNWWDTLPPGLEPYRHNSTDGRSQIQSDPGSASISHLESTDILGEEIESLAIDESLDPALTYAAPWELATADGVPVWPGPSVRSPEKEEVLDSLWNDEEKQEEKQEVCSVHGVICKRGICQEHSRRQKEVKREKERLDREKAAAAKGKKKRKGSGNGQGDGSSTTCQPAQGGTGSNSHRYGSDDGASTATSNWRRGDERANKADETASTADDDRASSGWSMKKSGKSRAWQ